MSAARRIKKSRSHLTLNHKTESRNHLHLHRLGNRVILPDLVAEETALTSVWLVARRPSLGEHALVYRWLARWLYGRIHWTPDYGIEYQGVYSDEAEARWAAGAPGMFVMEVPFNACLPEETCQYGKHDFPLSDASASYRNRKLPFVAVPRGQIEKLQDAIRASDPIIEGFRAKAI